MSEEHVGATEEYGPELHSMVVQLRTAEEDNLHLDGSMHSWNLVVSWVCVICGKMHDAKVIE